MTVNACFGLDLPNMQAAENGRFEPKPTDVAESTNVSDAQKADFAKLPFNVSLA
ncbi:hypothetical protein GS625_21485 [Ruegeria sp. HKCCD7319]|nr:hypothetical protein [Ruegeria sp. HKCCD7319]